MKRLAGGFTASIALLVPMPSQAQSPGSNEAVTSMEISRNGSRPSAKGPPGNFTGSVRVDPLFDARDPARASAGLVTFEPGARSAWHSHPLGQRLIVTSGLGWTQVEGGAVEEIRPGDVVWCPPNVRHWHGATPTTGVTHIAIQEAQDGTVVDWMEHVTDAQYRARPQR
jgi:quercetin dioxygenase-like cupin family protein